MWSCTSWFPCLWSADSGWRLDHRATAVFVTCWYRLSTWNRILSFQNWLTSDLWFACFTSGGQEYPQRTLYWLHSVLHLAVLMEVIPVLTGDQGWRRERPVQKLPRKRTPRSLPLLPVSTWTRSVLALYFFLDLLKEVKQHLSLSTIQETERSWILLYRSIIKYFSMTHHMGLEAVFRFGAPLSLAPLQCRRRDPTCFSGLSD